MTRILGVYLLAGGAAGLACSPAASVDPRRDLDRAVDVFVSGDYPAAVERFDAVCAAANDDATRREACLYLGRAHMALGDTDAAFEAFTMGVRYGDRGPCVAYLELLKQYVAGSPGGLHMRETLTRADLAGAAVRLFAPEAGAPSPTGPTPLAEAADRGWMPPLADGVERADAPVTRAALYIVVARVLADGGLAGRAHEAMPGGFALAVRSSDPVSGAEALAVLERVKAMRDHGR